ncbi:TPA: DUF1372 family protein [Streptococcus pneumoniae]|nr:DUF1372 family protein [Streptococcus pneumoniae]
MIDGRLKPPQKFFDWCYSQIPTIKWSNKSQTIQSGRTGCRVVEKEQFGKLYTITIRDYGIFVVTKEVYDTVKVGDGGAR